jgi:hypothetical protein
MMINRTMDYARDTSVQLRRGEVAQDYLAYQNKVLSDIQKEQVSGLEQKDEARVKANERREKESGEGAKKKKKPKGALSAAAPPGEAFEPDDPTVGVPLPKMLDIEV